MGRTEWLDQGVAILREHGRAGLQVDRLARRVGLTKGSFHHHFAGAPDYRRALLEHCVARDADAIQAVSAQLSGLAPAEALAALAQASLLDLPLDRALRAWAIGDLDARAAVDRIDRARLALLEGLWRQVVADPGTARSAALLPYLVTVGASVAAIDESDLQEVYQLLTQLIPAVPR